MTNPTSITVPDGVPFIDMVREFDAPRAEVYRAYTEPALVTQWLGPHGYAMTITEYDVRSGGSWAFSHLDPDGNSWGFHGTFHSVDPNESIVQTFEFEGMPGHVSLESVRFEDLDGRTRVVAHAAYQSVEARDAMAAGGMEKGVREGYERLDALLAVTT
ncbi:MAG: polyketide cyclase [Microbacteriaceae bacterium]|jgi:uncharacterized protein YndB with AHSA1/START domain|nr:polyketide cyclase [Microbacteriaceae bacterium]HEV7955540.1 SRPBCC family protein [Marisediminicola sp.]